MFRILCFGDSNTWGFRPDKPFHRYPPDIRWTGVNEAAMHAMFDRLDAAYARRERWFSLQPA